jgi:hypothetical protein
MKKLLTMWGECGFGIRQQAEFGAGIRGGGRGGGGKGGEGCGGGEVVWRYETSEVQKRVMKSGARKMRVF